MSWFQDAWNGAAQAVRVAQKEGEKIAAGAVEAVQVVQKEGERIAVDALEVVQKEGEKIVNDVTATTNLMHHLARSTLSFSKKLDDKDLILLLALAARDSYNLSGNCRGRLKLVQKEAQNAKDFNNMLKFLQWGLYEILDGKHRGKKILAYRGTDLKDVVTSSVTILQDISLIIPGGLNGQPIRLAIKDAVGIAMNKDPDFICGHSLGGLIAECVCGETGKYGASFNAPGPWGAIPTNNLLTGDKYKEAKFEAHLTSDDLVSNFGSLAGPEYSHVGIPIWHSEGGHGIEAMVKNLDK